MLVREYSEADQDALHAIHAAQGFDYAFPDLRNPLFVTKLVLLSEDVAPRGIYPDPVGSPASSLAETAPKDVALKGGATQANPASEDAHAAGEGNCHIVGAAFLRLTAEAYLLLDPRAGTPRERWQWLLALHEAARRDDSWTPYCLRFRM